MLTKNDVGARIADAVHIADTGGPPANYGAVPENIPIMVTMKRTYKIKNNYTEPAQLKIFEHTCVSENANTPLTLANQLMSEVSNGGVNFIDVQFDFNTVYIKGGMKKYWKQTGYQVALLRGGDTMELTFFNFWKGNKMDFDQIVDAYWKGCKVVTFRIQGEVCHDVSPNLTSKGYDKARLDMIIHDEFSTVSYGDGAPRSLESNMLLPTLGDQVQVGPNVVPQ